MLSWILVFGVDVCVWGLRVLVCVSIFYVC